MTNKLRFTTLGCPEDGKTYISDQIFPNQEACGFERGVAFKHGDDKASIDKKLGHFVKQRPELLFARFPSGTGPKAAVVRREMLELLFLLMETSTSNGKFLQYLILDFPGSLNQYEDETKEDGSLYCNWLLRALAHDCFSTEYSTVFTGDGTTLTPHLLLVSYADSTNMSKRMRDFPNRRDYMIGGVHHHLQEASFRMLENLLPYIDDKEETLESAIARFYSYPYQCKEGLQVLPPDMNPFRFEEGITGGHFYYDFGFRLITGCFHYKSDTGHLEAASRALWEMREDLDKMKPFGQVVHLR